MPTTFINELKANSPIKAIFLCKKKLLKRTKEDKPYLEVTLSDKTGKIEGRAWENAEELNKEFNEGDVVKISGGTTLFKNELQIKVDDIKKAKNSEYAYENLIRAVASPEKIFEKINNLLSAIKDEWLVKLKDSFLNDAEFIDKFLKSPGAKSWHNAYIGGLLEHTYEVMHISNEVHNLYPESSLDILMIGSFMHDMGKIYELDTNTFEYTLEGGLVGHVSIGYKMLGEKIRNIDGFPKDLALELEHIILSHHGEYEQQSPVLPKTLEATIIYQADELVSQANAVKELQDSFKNTSDASWSNFVSIKNRKYLLRKNLKA